LAWRPARHQKDFVTFTYPGMLPNLGCGGKGNISKQAYLWIVRKDGCSAVFVYV
jgi:hypothetical protein